MSGETSESEIQEKDDGLWARLRRSLSLRAEASLREHLEEAIEGGEGADVPKDDRLSADERAMLLKVLSIREVRVDDVMVPRADIVSVPSTTSFKDLVDVISDAGHSRIPVYGENLDDVLGMVHVKDILPALMSKGEERPLSEYLRPVLFVPPSMRPMDLLGRMKRRRTHMAIVVDEFGGSDGLITIEDLVEQIVGEIQDEHDEDENLRLERVNDHTVIVDARVPIEDLESEVGLSLLENEEEAVDTVGGLTVALEGRVPRIGETLTLENGVGIEVLDADPRRLKLVRVHLVKDGSTA